MALSILGTRITLSRSLPLSFSRVIPYQCVPAYSVYRVTVTNRPALNTALKVNDFYQTNITLCHYSVIIWTPFHSISLFLKLFFSITNTECLFSKFIFLWILVILLLSQSLK